MDRFHRSEGPNGTEGVDCYVRSAAERSRPLQRSSTYKSLLRQARSAPVASAHIRGNGSERLALGEDDQLRRRDRVIGHAILGAIAIVVFLAMLPIIRSLGTFVVAMAALFVGLRSFTFAVSIWLDDAWGWTRDGGMSVPLRWSDHAVLAGMGWLHRRSEAAIDEPPTSAIQVLPPEPPR